MSYDPNDADFKKNLKRLLGMSSEDINDLLPKIDADTLIDLASAVTDGNKEEALKLIYTGRIRMMKENKFVRSSNIHFSIGDDVKANNKTGTIKIPNGPSNTVGVMIAGKLEMIDHDDVKKIEESVMGMTNLPSMERMLQLAGVSSTVDAPVSTEVSVPEVPATFGNADKYCDETGCTNSETAMQMLDKLCEILPDLRLADIKIIRKKLYDITSSLNESFNSRSKNSKKI